MSNKDTLLRKLSILVFIALVAAIIWVNRGHLEKLNLSSKLSPSPTPTTTDLKIINAPVRIDHPNLGQVFLVYNFFGSLKELQEVGTSSKITLDTQSDQELPEFIFDKNQVPIFKTVEGKQESASFTDLKVGQNIGVQMMYDLKVATWKLIRLDIFSN